MFKFQDFITHKTTIMLYKGNNQKAVSERLLNKHSTRQLFYVKKKKHHRQTIINYYQRYTCMEEASKWNNTISKFATV